jgi:hypothetical protein
VTSLANKAELATIPLQVSKSADSSESKRKLLESEAMKVQVDGENKNKISEAINSQSIPN